MSSPGIDIRGTGKNEKGDVVVNSKVSKLRGGRYHPQHTRFISHSICNISTSNGGNLEIAQVRLKYQKSMS